LELVYSSYLGGVDFDFCNGIAVDSSGNAYLTGASTSSGLATVGAFQTQFGGGVNYGDAFVAKIKSGGTGIAYYTYVGGSGDDAADQIAIDSAGNAYIAGWTQSSTDFPLKNPLQSTYGGGAPGSTLTACGCAGGDAFITEINPTGTALVYSTYFGGTGLDVANGIAVDSAGNAYVAGVTTSAKLEVTAGALESKLPGQQDGFVLEIAPQGTSLEYSSYLGGSNNDAAWKIAATNGGNIYVTGTTQSSNFPTAKSQHQRGYQRRFILECARGIPGVAGNDIRFHGRVAACVRFHHSASGDSGRSFSDGQRDCCSDDLRQFHPGEFPASQRSFAGAGHGGAGIEQRFEPAVPFHGKRSCARDLHLWQQSGGGAELPLALGQRSGQPGHCGRCRHCLSNRDWSFEQRSGRWGIDTFQPAVNRNVFLFGHHK